MPMDKVITKNEKEEETKSGAEDEEKWDTKSTKCSEQSKRDRCSPTSAGSTNLSLRQRNISLFQKREFLLLPDIISFPSEYRTEALLNRI